MKETRITEGVASHPGVQAQGRPRYLGHGGRGEHMRKNSNEEEGSERALTRWLRCDA